MWSENKDVNIAGTWVHSLHMDEDEFDSPCHPGSRARMNSEPDASPDPIHFICLGDGGHWITEDRAQVDTWIEAATAAPRVSLVESMAEGVKLEMHPDENPSTARKQPPLRLCRTP